MIQRDMPLVEATLNKESYDFLVDNWPELAQAIEGEVRNGARPDEVGRFVMRKTQRERLAMRSRQAAGHLCTQREAELVAGRRTAVGGATP